ncbi:peptidylprolyl isomerase [Candidatus Woesearchaeota archaeon]|nr:peptidylprolyl isomerase [Candidatus Woesearchaeota archaeon]
MPVKEGDTVSIEYTGTFDDGTVFDSSEKHGKPLEFKTGAKQVVPGFEKAIIGMEKDEEKEVKIPPSEAYGEPNPGLVKPIPREQMKLDQEPQVGMALMVGVQDGQQMPAKIVDVNEKEVHIDLNHPLAGKTLNFKIKVVDIKQD